MHRYSIHSVDGNRQALDGGAMFGNAPRALWQRWITPDEHNRIPLACRAFLIVDHAQNRRILLDAGIGSFFEPRLRDRYGVTEQGHRLLENLAAMDVAPGAIDVVVLSHLHFDHAGGVLQSWQDGQPPRLVFPAAQFVVGARAFDRAVQPHPRDRASFISELPQLLRDTNRLTLIDDADADHPLGPDFSVIWSEGHTPGLMLTELCTTRGTVVFGADLIPGCPWIHAPITMGYDRFPERVVEEKTELLERCAADGIRLLFPHDPHTAMATVTRDERGKYGADQRWEIVDGLRL